MPGLNSLISNQTNQTTSLPSWYDTAQQQLTSDAQAASRQVPGVSGTVVGNEVNKLNSAQNPFTQAQGTLGTIASGAANPWLTDAAGNVTPNTSTAMGGLFEAQKDYLNSVLPDINATASAGSIGGGGFGSKMNIGAVEKARAQAANQLFQNQMQSALQNQQTGVQAASGLGTTGEQESRTNLGVGQFQQNAPLAGVTGAANIISPLRTGTTVNNQTQLSPLNQIAGIAQMLGGTGGLLSTIPALGTQIGNLFGGILNPNNTSSPFYNTGTGTAGDQEGDFPQYGTNGYDTSNNVDQNYVPVAGPNDIEG